jgi:sarcosine oxidase, subunit alpha
MIFRWNGRPIEARPGDTIAIALWRHGIRAVGFSRKRHRPLGVAGHVVQGALVTVDGRPHVHADHTVAVSGMDVWQQGGWPHPRFDLLKLARVLPQRWTRGGFERPYWLRSGTKRFELWERLLMSLAGEVDPPKIRVPAPAGLRWNGDVVVVGGGPAGVRAANAAAAAGQKVCLVSRSRQAESYANSLGHSPSVIDSRVVTLFGHEAAGIYRRGTVVLAVPRQPEAAASALVCRRLVIATGRESVGPIVPGHNLPGVFDSRTALRWAPALGSDLGPTVVVGTGAESQVADALRRHGVDVIALSAASALREILGRGAVRGARFDGGTVACRSLVHAGPWIANNALAFQASASGTLRLTQTSLPSNVQVAGSAADATETLALRPDVDLSRVSVCACMDVSAQEIVSCLDSGERHVEEIKRSTACGMGPCQGFPCWETMRSVMSSATGSPISDVPSSRPPCRGITVAQAAGLDGLIDLE